MFLLLTSCGLNSILKRAQYDENSLIESAQNFHCNDVFLSKGVAMKKYKGYLDRTYSYSIKLGYLGIGIPREDYNESWRFLFASVKKI
jgi:hypothetical protein